MDGPAGVSWYQDRARPAHTATRPIRLAPAAICSGVRAWRWAAAAGMISSEVISSTPTIFIATAITTAISSISARRMAATGRPSTCASSSCTVIASSERHSQASAASTRALPATIHSRSAWLTASRSPNR
ncbi:hypothetical protein D3C78_1458960 [compost metagenome]